MRIKFGSPTFSRKASLVGLALLTLFFLLIPFTVFLSQQQQDIRQRAAGKEQQATKNTNSDNNKNNNKDNGNKNDNSKSNDTNKTQQPDTNKNGVNNNKSDTAKKDTNGNQNDTNKDNNSNNSDKNVTNKDKDTKKPVTNPPPPVTYAPTGIFIPTTIPTPTSCLHFVCNTSPGIGNTCYWQNDCGGGGFFPTPLPTDTPAPSVLTCSSLGGSCKSTCDPNTEIDQGQLDCSANAEQTCCLAQAPLSLTPTDTPVPTPTLTPTPVLSPTNTPLPTASEAPSLATTSLSFTVLLDGIGNAGDSANPTGKGNFSPQHPTRTLTVEVYDTGNQLVATQQGGIAFDSTAGAFNGTITLDSLAGGVYTVKVKTDQYLKALVPGIQTVSAGAVNQMPPVRLIAGDINGDNVINILDYNILMGCYSDLLPATDCTPANAILADLNDDGAVNQFDYNLFLREIGNSIGQ